MSEKQRLYVDVHVIQTLPPSCVNRDDTGSPKTAVYGGVTRARVSSQCWKRAVRTMFKDEFPAEQLGLRTKRIVRLVMEKLDALGFAGDAEKAAIEAFKAAGLKIKDADKGTDAMFFISDAQARSVAEIIAGGEKPDKKRLQSALIASPAVDVALFGRMVADDPSLNTDACAQVAHAISTHRISNEYDYFTAVDDMAPEDNSGAGHIGSTEFNSSTLYRYATVAVHELRRQLGAETARAATEFVRAFACAMPTGKQNTFANRTLPDAVLIALRTDQPVNLAGAFEKPVASGDHGYAQASCAALVQQQKRCCADFVGKPAMTLVTGEMLRDLAEPHPFPETLEMLEAALAQRLQAGEQT